MAQRILGLDLGARHVKAVLLETTLRGFEVAAAAEFRFRTAPSPSASGRGRRCASSSPGRAGRPTRW